jgi:hypothetical protein
MKLLSSLSALAAVAVAAQAQSTPSPSAASIGSAFVDALHKANLTVLATLASNHAQALVSPFTSTQATCFQC